MSEYLTLRTEAGEIVLVETEDGQGRAPAARERIEEADGTLESRLGQLKRVLWSAAATLRDMPRRPDRLTVEVGAKFVAGAGVIIARTSAEASIKVVAEWRSDSAGAEQPAPSPSEADSAAPGT
jgi:Trypsin-co-occurring domain 1